MVETYILTFPEEIRKPTLRKLQDLNSKVKVFKLGPSKNQLEITPNLKFDLKPLFSGYKSIVDVYDIICKLNPEVVFELYGTLFLIKQMSGISSGIESKITEQLGVINGNGPAELGSLHSGSPEFKINPLINNQFRRPDIAWMTFGTENAITPVFPNKRYNGVPELVIEIRSESQSQMEQKDKMGEWINSGVEFGILVDYINQHTFRYATAASGLLPAIGNVNATGGTAHVHPNVIYAGITEEDFIWPALPPLAVNGLQYGPAFVVQIPVGTAFGQAVGGNININHANFRVV